MIIIINIIREKRSIVQQKDWMSWYPVIQSHQPPRQTLWRDGHIDTDVHGTRFSVLFESTTVITPSSVLSTYHDGRIDTDVHGTRFSVLFESTTVITPSSVLSTYHRQNEPPSLPPPGTTTGGSPLYTLRRCIAYMMFSSSSSSLLLVH